MPKQEQNERNKGELTKRNERNKGELMKNKERNRGPMYISGSFTVQPRSLTHTKMTEVKKSLHILEKGRKDV